MYQIYLFFSQTVVTGDTRLSFGVSPTHAEILEDTLNGHGKDHNRDRMHPALGRYAHLPFRCSGDPILTTGTGISGRIPCSCMRKSRLWLHTIHHPSRSPGCPSGKATHPYERRPLQAHPGISSQGNVNNSKGITGAVHRTGSGSISLQSTGGKNAPGKSYIQANTFLSVPRIPQHYLSGRNQYRENRPS